MTHKNLIGAEENPESLYVWWEGSFLSITDKTTGACIQISGQLAVEMANAILRADLFEGLVQYGDVA